MLGGDRNSSAGVSRLLSWFLPADVSDRRRGNLLVGTCLTIVVFAIPLGFLYARAEGRFGPTSATFAIGSLAMLINLLLLRRGVSLSRVGVIATAEIVAALATMAVFNGGIESAATLWLPVIALLAGIWVGRRYAALCGGLIIVVIVGLYAARAAGYEFPRPLTDTQMFWWQTIGLVTVTAFLVVLVWLYEGETVQELTARAEQIDERTRDLERLQADFRQVIENNPDAVLVCRESRVVYANPRCVEWFRAKRRADLLGLDVLDAVDPKQRQRLADRLGGKALGHAEFRFKRLDGTKVDLELSMAIEIMFDDSPALLLVGRDASERIAMQRKLVFADRMSTLGTLAAGVAHEINNPLTYVMANLEHMLFRLSEGGTLSPKHRDRMVKAVEDALYGSERVREIVRDLSHLARPEQREDDPIDIRRAVQSSLRMAQHQIRKRAAVVEDIEEVPIVRGSSARLSQVFLNLLINAAHAIEEGDAENNEVTVRTRTVDGRVLVEIVDTGRGIPAEVLPRIFDPFFTTKDVGMGTGLGLSICHAIVIDHLGEIEVSSEIGEGTTFRVLLPADTTTADEEAEKPGSEPDIEPTGTEDRPVV